MFIVFRRATRRAAAWSLAGQFLAVQSVVALTIVVLATGLAYRQASRQADGATRIKVTQVAWAIAATDDVVEGLRASDPSSALAAFAERERTQTGTDFVVIMAVDGTRYTHPDPGLVGGRFVGTTAPAAAGGMVVEEFTGSLGPSTRAVVPVTADGQVIGLVAVGIRREVTAEAFRDLIPDIVGSALAVGLICAVGSWLLARRVRRQTLGLNADELRRLHDHHEAVLYAVREGLVIVDASGRLQVINDEASRLLEVPADQVGHPVADLGLAEPLVEALTGATRRADDLLVSGGRILVVSSAAVHRHGRVEATLTTLRDRTELEELTGDLSRARQLSDALHSQAHEAANRLHTVVTLIELGRLQEAISFATDELRTVQRLTDAVVSAVDDPAVSALLLGKIAQAAESGVTLDVDPEAHLPGGMFASRDLVTILGNLIDNAIDALNDPHLPERTITVDAQLVPADPPESGTTLLLTVADTGAGFVDGVDSAFVRGWSTKSADGPAGRGLGLVLVKQIVERLGGTICVSPPPGAVFTVRLPTPDRPPDRQQMPSGTDR